MRDKDYREIQLSSSLLVFIFIGILILGVVIFLLGVSVGKKQAQIMGSSEFAAGVGGGQGVEKVSQKPVTPLKEEPRGAIGQELASHQKSKEKKAQTAAKKPATSQLKPATGAIYFIQLGAFKDKKAANTLAEKFRKKGYSPLVLAPFPTDKNPVYRVRLGSFKSLDEAKALKAKLIQAEKKKKADYFIGRK